MNDTAKMGQTPGASESAPGNQLLFDSARRLVQSAEAAGLALRLFGGIAIWERCRERSRAALGREYADVDLVSHRHGSRELRELLEGEGYEPERVFNATHGAGRLLYHAPDHAFHIDVFLDHFEMSHKLDFTDRLELEPLTLPAADLLLAKLQVAEVNRKDMTDAAMLLLDHELAERDGEHNINAAYVAEVCAGDWGLFTTCSDNLGRLAEMKAGLLQEVERERVGRQIATLTGRMEATPKSRGWKLRARVGRRKRWYEVPEEVLR